MASTQRFHIVITRFEMNALTFKVGLTEFLKKYEQSFQENLVFIQLFCINIYFLWCYVKGVSIHSSLDQGEGTKGVRPLQRWTGPNCTASQSDRLESLKIETCHFHGKVCAICHRTKDDEWRVPCRFIEPQQLQK